MKVLFAMGDVQVTEKIAEKYFEKYSEQIDSKNVFYFKALLNEVKNDKTYDRIVISEDIEQAIAKNVEQLDRDIFNYIDKITDEIEDSEIIVICSDRRHKENDEFVARLFNIGVYNMLIGNDRSVSVLCERIKKPMNKKEAKRYLHINPITTSGMVSNDDETVDEAQIASILRYFEETLNGKPEEYVRAFDRVAEQYSRNQLKVIFYYMPPKVKPYILSENRYKFLVEDMPGNSVDVSNENKTSKTVINKPAKKGLFGILKENKNKEKNNSRNNDVQVDIMPKVQVVPKANETSSVTNESAEVRAQRERDEQLRKEKELKERKLLELEQEKIRKKVEEDDLAREQAESKQKADFEAFAREQEELKKKAEQEAFLREQEALKHKAEQERLLKEQEELKQRAEQERLLKEQEKLKQRAEQERLLKEQAEQKQRAEQERLLKEQEKLKQRAEQERLLKEQAEQKQRAEQERLLKEQAEQKQRAEQERLLKEQEKLKQRAEQERLLKEQAEQKQRAEQERLLKEQAEQKQRAEQERLLKEQAELKQRAEQEALAKQQEELKKKAEQDRLAEERKKIEQERLALEAEREKLRQQSEQLTKTAEQTMISARENENTYATQQVDYKKMVVFVGANKTGTTFLVNAVAHNLADNKIKTGILDMTKGKSMYYIYNQDDEGLRKIAAECMQKLSENINSCIPAEKNLNVYTSVPGGYGDTRKTFRNKAIIDTVQNSNSLVIVDADFTTPLEYYEKADTIYIVQDLDIMRIQEITSFLRELKNRSVDMKKIKVIINKYLKTSVTPKRLMDGLSCYVDPQMVFVDEIFDKKVPYFTVPFEIENYINYIEGMAKNSISYKKCTPNFLSAINELSADVFKRGGDISKKKKGLFW